MSINDIKNASAVIKAIRECDELGRDTFLQRYGFGKAKKYFLVHDGKYYDSKAITAVAHKYEFPDKEILTPSDFSGGEKTVGDLLNRLGFSIEEREEPFPIPGDVLTHNQLMRAFGVGMQGGMRRSRKNNLLLLISDPTKSLYDDRWEGDTLHYTGMGKIGDQKLDRQNKTLVESNESDIRVHLCEVFDATKYTYAGEVELVDTPYQEQQLDEELNDRLVFMFPLKLVGNIHKLTPDQKNVLKIQKDREESLKNKSLEELKKIASKSKAKPQKRTVKNDQIIRNAAVADYVKKAANGNCDLCEKQAPFFTKKKEPYLECHHVIPLANDGDDTIENAVALCPNCHRKMHSLNLKADLNFLMKKIEKRK